MRKSVENFMRHALIDLLNNKSGIELIQKKRTHFMQGDAKIFCNGYFDEPALLHCAIKKPQKEWLPIFIHEYCHFQQYKEKAPVYMAVNKTPGMEDFDEWVKEKKESKRPIMLRCARAIQKMELDCERRVVAKIEEFGLPLDTEAYIKRANVYGLFYNFVYQERKWYETRPPYEVNEILDKMPGVWLKSYTKSPEWFNKMVLKHCCL